MQGPCKSNKNDVRPHATLLDPPAAEFTESSENAEISSLYPLYVTPTKTPQFWDAVGEDFATCSNSILCCGSIVVDSC